MATTFYFHRGFPFAHAAVGSTSHFDRPYRGAFVAPTFASAASINGTGSLAVASVVFAGAGSVQLNGAGSLAVGSIVFAGESPPASFGSLAVDDVALAGVGESVFYIASSPFAAKIASRRTADVVN